MHVYPVAGTDKTGIQSGVLVQEHSPIEKCILVWIARRQGMAPAAPPPAPLNNNYILTDRQIGIPTPMINGNGLVETWVLSGIYYYDLLTPGYVIRDFPGLANTLSTATTTQHVTPAKAFTRGSASTNLGF